MDRQDDENKRAREEESSAARIERLGRERPLQFKTTWAEVGFIFSIAMSQVLTVRVPRAVHARCYRANMHQGVFCLWIYRHPSNASG